MRRSPIQLRGRYGHTLSRVTEFPFLTCVIVLLALTTGSERSIAQDQASFSSNPSATAVTNPCSDPSVHVAIKEAFHLVCSKDKLPVANQATQEVIVIGFVGGFVRRNDVKHPEVLFANYLRSRYGSIVHAAVFGNRETKEALELIHESLGTNNSGSQASGEHKRVKIILYGHSWGASQVLEFARELEREKIPVSLTIQVDSVRKMGQNDRSVPANVERAVNFYQSKGLTPGRPLIVPANAEQTKILGNYHMTYKHEDIRCDNYHWLSRVFNKPHHQIENDPNVWDQIVTLIDSELSSQNRVEAAQSASHNSEY
jgi:hypothetical protein